MPNNKASHSKCKSCGAPVIWLTHVVNQTKAPIDAEPNITGKCVVDLAQGTYSVLARKNDAPVGTEFYTSHFQTCPDQKEWRRKKTSVTEQAVEQSAGAQA